MKVLVRFLKTGKRPSQNLHLILMMMTPHCFLHSPTITKEEQTPTTILTVPTLQKKPDDHFSPLSIEDTDKTVPALQKKPDDHFSPLSIEDKDKPQHEIVTPAAVKAPVAVKGKKHKKSRHKGVDKSTDTAEASAHDSVMEEDKNNEEKLIATPLSTQLEEAPLIVKEELDAPSLNSKAQLPQEVKLSPKQEVSQEKKHLTKEQPQKQLHVAADLEQQPEQPVLQKKPDGHFSPLSIEDKDKPQHEIITPGDVKGPAAVKAPAAEAPAAVKDKKHKKSRHKGVDKSTNTAEASIYDSVTEEDKNNEEKLIATPLTTQLEEVPLIAKEELDAPSLNSKAQLPQEVKLSPKQEVSQETEKHLTKEQLQKQELAAVKAPAAEAPVAVKDKKHKKSRHKGVNKSTNTAPAARVVEKDPEASAHDSVMEEDMTQKNNEEKLIATQLTTQLEEEPLIVKEELDIDAPPLSSKAQLLQVKLSPKQEVSQEKKHLTKEQPQKQLHVAANLEQQPKQPQEEELRLVLEDSKPKKQKLKEKMEPKVPIPPKIVYNTEDDGTAQTAVIHLGMEDFDDDDDDWDIDSITDIDEFFIQSRQSDEQDENMAPVPVPKIPTIATRQSDEEDDVAVKEIIPTGQSDEKQDGQSNEKDGQSNEQEDAVKKVPTIGTDELDEEVALVPVKKAKKKKKEKKNKKKEKKGRRKLEEREAPQKLNSKDELEGEKHSIEGTKAHEKSPNLSYASHSSGKHIL